jgi:hypothetical protein
MRKALVIGVVLLAAAAYLIGFVPQRNRRIILEEEVASLKSRLEDAEARGRLCALYVRTQGLVQLVAQKNYGQAQQLSSGLFNDVRAEASRSQEPEFKKALLGVLEMRDTVTAGLTQGDAGTLDHLHRAAGLLQAALVTSGTPAPTAPSPAPGPKP